MNDINKINKIANYYFKFASSITKKDFKDLLKSEHGNNIKKFLEAISLYQGNAPYSPYKSTLYEAWIKLPVELKENISAKPATLKKMWRGDDGKSKEPAISWTTNKSLAKFYGTFVYHFPKTIESYEGTLDTSRLAKLLPNEIMRQIDIGNDEDEIIVFKPTWKISGGFAEDEIDAERS